MTAPGPEPGVKKIAVVRANALGDFLATLPALEALEAAYPAAEIVLLAKPWHAAFLAGRPGPVDRVVVIPAVNGVGAGGDAPPAELAAFFGAMRAERFDLALQMHGGGGHSNPFTRRLGARLAAGLAAAGAMSLDRTARYDLYQPEVARLLELVALVGARPVSLEPRVTVTVADAREAAAVLPEGGGPLVVLHPGATDPRRHWPAEKFARVGDALARAGARVAVTGTGGEAALAGAVAGAMAEPAENLCGRLSLNGLTGLLARCALVVSSDSGPPHLAAAVGTATVTVFWCGNLIVWGPLTRTRHRAVVSWRLECPVCGLDCTRGDCEHRASFVAEVPVEAVLGQALELLEGAGGRRA